MLKGHLEIELKDEKTGEVVKHKEDNMVTSAVAKLLGLASIHAGASNTNTTKLLYYLLPIAQKALGGLFLFDGTLEESEDNIHFPMDVHLTGSAGRKANTSSTIVGSYNSTESHRNDNGFTSVWDFTTSQANGTIASLSLTNYLAGENPFNGIFQYVSDKIVTSRSYLVIAYNPQTEILYLLNSGKIYSKKMYGTILSVNSPDFGAEEEIFSFNFTSPSYNYWTICNGYDGYIYAINCSTVSSKKTATFKIRKIKISDFSFTDEGEQTVSVDNVTCHATGYMDYRMFATHCVSKGFLYFTSYDATSIYKVNLSNIADVREIKLGDDVIANYIFPYYNGGIYVDFSFYKNSESGARTRYYSPGWITIDEKVSFNKESTTIGSSEVYYYCNFEGDNLFMVKNENSSCLCYGFIKNYLGTICNLSSPVVKTSAQTMKITYTLTDA